MSTNISVIVSYSVILLGLTNGATMASQVFQPLTNSQSPDFGYLLTSKSVFPKLHHATFIHQTADTALRDSGAFNGNLTKQGRATGYSNLGTPLIVDLQSFLKNQRIQSIADKQRSQKETQSNHNMAAIRITEPQRPSTTPKPKIENRSNIPRSSYEVVEEDDEYLANDLKHSDLPYPKRIEPASLATSLYRSPQDVTTTIRILDNFLSRVLNDNSYNSELHPPPNPLLALVLSRYGRYIPGPRNSRAYAYMTVNNIHNNKPFGNYKVEYEQVPTYVRRR